MLYFSYILFNDDHSNGQREIIKQMKEISINNSSNRSHMRYGSLTDYLQRNNRRFICDYSRLCQHQNDILPHK